MSITPPPVDRCFDVTVSVIVVWEKFNAVS